MVTARPSIRAGERPSPRPGSRIGSRLRRRPGRGAGRAVGEPVSSRPAPAARPRTTEPGSRGRGPALTARGVALLVVALLSLASVLGPLRAWAEQRGELDGLRSDIVAREHRVADLQAESDRWDDPAYVATQARGRLQYVMPGETGYVVLGAPPSGASSAAPSASGGLPTTLATPTAPPQDPASLLQRLRQGLGLTSEAAPSPTPTPADIAPATAGGSPTPTPMAEAP